jgi:4-amino-4-deoxy-L-arabinose transferase-like glycosyltransferase
VHDGAEVARPSINYPLLAVLAVALLLRLGWALSRPVDEQALASLPDQREYLALGRNLVQGRGLGFTDPRFSDVVYAFRTPGYPLLVAMCGGNVRLVRAAQAILDTSTCLAVYLLARRWLSRGSSVFASLVCAVHPFLIYFCGLILTETLFTTMLAWGMVLLMLPRRRWWIPGAIILALSVLVRPGAIALPVVLGIAAAFLNTQQAKPYHRWSLPVGTTMLLLTLLVLLPWGLRNSRVVGRWIWTSTNSGFTAYDGFNPDATGASDQSFIRDMPQLRRMTEVERSEYLAEKAKTFMRENPLRSLELAVVKIGRTWSPRPLSAEFSRPLYVAVAYAFAGPVYLLAVLGLSYRTLPRFAKLFLLAPAIYLTVSAALSVGSLRYRVPAEPYIAILAAAGAELTVRKLMERPAFVRVSVESEEGSGSADENAS